MRKRSLLILLPLIAACSDAGESGSVARAEKLVDYMEVQATADTVVGYGVEAEAAPASADVVLQDLSGPARPAVEGRAHAVERGTASRSGERYARLAENAFVSARRVPLSTFGIDVTRHRTATCAAS